jgi:hypothetical protein
MEELLKITMHVCKAKRKVQKPRCLFFVKKEATGQNFGATSPIYMDVYRFPNNQVQRLEMLFNFSNLSLILYAVQVGSVY